MNYIISALITIVFIILALSAVLALMTAYTYYNNWKDDKAYERLMREQKALNPQKPPLTWTRENGFNRAPTLAEAEKFAVDSDGDTMREFVSLHGEIPSDNVS